MGNLHELIDTIAAMSVAVGSTTPTVYDVDEAQGWAQKSALPLRFITPFSTPPMAVSIGDFGIGNTALFTWTVTDRLLWRRLDGGMGPPDSANELVTYLDNYADAVKALQDWSGVDTSNDIQVSVELVARSQINWPIGSDNLYIGADAVWTIMEVDP